ncbi:RNA polymerase sigma factor [Cytophagaceae bacterium ABcell3]|nr:RNA polymerase sigma factor [Cytophagaceae bacterium ABcell3]
MNTAEFTYSLQEAIGNLKPAAYKLTKNTEEANDLLQETYLRAYDQKNKFLKGSNLNAWIYTIMKNIFINNYQRMVRRKTFLDTTELQFFVNNPGREEKKRDTYYESLTGSELRKALKKLNKDQRVPFIMHFTGYKYYEIAESLQIPLGTVKTRIRNARKNLQVYLKEYQYN